MNTQKNYFTTKTRQNKNITKLLIIWNIKSKIKVSCNSQRMDLLCYGPTMLQLQHTYMYCTFLFFKPCLDEKNPAVIQFVQQCTVQTHGSNVRMNTNRKATLVHNDSGKGKHDHCAKNPGELSCYVQMLMYIHDIQVNSRLCGLLQACIIL